MSKPGPKPTPAPVVAISNPGKRAQPRNLPQPEPLVEDTAPDWLLPAARDLFNELQPELGRWGLYTILDRPALWLYCQKYALYRHAIDQLIDPETGEPVTTYEARGRNGRQIKTRPEVAQAIEMSKQCRSWGSEFGLTPSSRRSLEGVTQADLFGSKLAELNARYDKSA